MKLLHFEHQPYARKVLWLPKKLELDLESGRSVVFPADLARINPLGKVPALVMDDGTTLFDSRVIVEYLDGLSPVHRLIPEASRDRIAAKLGGHRRRLVRCGDPGPAGSQPPGQE